MSDYLKNLEKYNLPEPTAISKLTFEDIKAEIISDIKTIKPDIQLVESDDYMVMLEAFAYRELYLRNLINEDIKKMLPHYSSGTDLDNFIFSFFGGEERLDGEDDLAFLQRAKLSLNSYSSAGSEQSYEYWTKSFSANIYDVKATKKSAGVVQIVYVAISAINESELYSFVSDKKVRPLTDSVELLEAKKVPINLEVSVTIFDSNSLENIKQQIIKNFSNRFYIGEKVIFSKVIDLLHINGVYRVDTNIKSDVEIASNEVAIINLSLTMEIKND